MGRKSASEPGLFHAHVPRRHGIGGHKAGCTDDMLKVGGIWVSPVEIEDTMMSHPAVLNVAVVAKKDEHDLIKPKAFVVLKEGCDPSSQLAQELQLFVKKNIAPYTYPRWIQFVDSLPMTSTGKIQRFKLRDA